ncbi:EutN/CcmL family microcompartment protein [Candidatus Uabimicrobium amorphum]|uniref:Ethanolamine utilization protein EutN n=1 Tax=Uabimicrobium amorphum TaxID=2596890 RepID=A0A5S9F4E3_UABAM|nr:EutN/CcmL family microcompartment protein [Candidatus Uabimicrobium amorphum]BBM85448.1 ethanolamine utilization protein EutN [Candidatus Uabimicrobium amorphum]
MILCKVMGNVVATHKNKELENNRLLLVQPIDLNRNPKGSSLVAFDRVDAGEGDIVLVVKEGGSARIAFNNKKIPLQSFIVGVVDDIDVDETILQSPWPVVSRS